VPRSPNCHIETPRVLGKFDVVRCKVKLCGIADVRSGLRLGHAVTGAPPSFDTHLYLCQYRHVLGHAYRAVYAVSIGDAIYVVHAFQKKSKAGIVGACCARDGWERAPRPMQSDRRHCRAQYPARVLA
jgi:Phage derived protein Gp49-like (DUF891)